MFRRFSIIHDITVFSIGISSIIQIGDTNTADLKNRNIAVQRETEFFLNNETPFEAYPMFTDTEITIPTRSTEVRMHTINACPFISVDHISIVSILNSSMIHAGSIDYVYSNSRIHQIRQYA
jgi:spore germination protein PE